MPTHQGKTHTDILIGDGGDNCTMEAFFEFSASYGTTAEFRYKRNNSAAADDEDSSYEIEVLDATGATLATFFAEYTCVPTMGTATDIDSTRTNSFTPAPDSSNPAGIPSAWQTYGSRSWSNSVKKNGQTFASYQANWQFASTVASGGSVMQSVNTQTNDKLEVTFTYLIGTNTVLSVVVTCAAGISVSSTNLQLGTPSASDTILP